MQRSQFVILALLVLTASMGVGKGVVGPAFHEDKTHAAPIPSSAPDYDSVDRIRGIGQFKFGAKLTDFAPGLLRAIDPRAKGVLLSVAPYGDNYLVTDLAGLTWGNIPLTGLVVTFHEGVLIDLQLALKSKKVDFYLVDRAFKDKYGPSDPKTFPVETWSGDQIQVTLIFQDTDVPNTEALDAPTQGKVELFDHGQWNKFEAARIAKLNKVLDKSYQDVGKKVISNL
jgi:hypothetical protein